MVFLANERLDFLKGDVSFLGLEGFRLEFPSDEPIGYVDVVLHIFLCGVGLKKVADADVEVREVLDFLAPGCVTVHVRKGDHITAVQDFQSLVELALSAGGQSKIIRHQSAADDRSLFRFHQSDWHIRELFQQMLSEKTLCQFPFLGQMTGAFQDAVNPVDFAFRVLVLDTFSRLGIIFHDLSGPASAVRINLEIYHIVHLGDSNLVAVYEHGYSVAVE